MSEKIMLTPEIILGFSDTYLKKNFDDPAQTPDAHLEWWHYCCLPRQYVALAAPRNHAKSTAITHTFVLASLCLRLKRHVLLVSDTEGQAAMFLGNIAREFRENEDLRNTFGVKRIVTDNETELVVQWADRSMMRVAAHGAQQKIRGTNWRGIRPDLIVCDDLENDEMVLNEDRRDKFRKWFRNTLLPIGGKKAIIRVVGTILHEDSLLNRMMPDTLEDRNCIIEPLRITTTTEKAFLGVLYRAHPDFDDFSEILWSEVWDEASLKLKRQAYIDDGAPEGYSQEYLNNPMASEGAYFQEEDMLQIPLEERLAGEKAPESFYIGVDLAISQKSKRAYSVFAVFGYDRTKTLRCREIIRKRMDSLEILDTFFHLHTKYRHKSAMGEEPIFLVEQENIAKSLGPVLYKKMEDEDQWITIEKMPPILDKMLRARSLQSRIRGHRVEFDHEAPWWPTLKHEMMTFPLSTYTDQVDAMAWVGHYIASMQEPPGWDEIEDDEWDDFEEDAGFDFGTANRVTGY